MWFRRKEKIRRPLFRRIINYFIYFGIGVLMLLLTGFAVTQTSSFRTWLKDTITEQVNLSTNGKLSIERIDGTLFTSLILNNILYEFQDDTVFAAEKMEIKTSPLKIVFKIIYFRKIEIVNANITLLKDENGELNISKIFPASEEPEDTLSSPFNWKLQVANLSLQNVNFRLQSAIKKTSSANYLHPDFDDLRLNDIDVELSAFADLVNHEYELFLKECRVKPNLNGFALKNLSGNFVYFEDNAVVTDLTIITERSNVSLSAAISDFPVFSENEISIAHAPLRVDLAATDFNFDDLTTFIESTDLLKGNVTTHLSASGTLSDLNVEKLRVAFNETSFELTGNLRNLSEGSDMIINTGFDNCTVDQDDITSLLPTTGIPRYEEYGILNFDSLRFRGKPLDFEAAFGLKTDLGEISGLLIMDLTGEEIIYDGKIRSVNLNLYPVAPLPTKLNCSGTLNGSGFSLSTLTTNLNINAFKSSIGDGFFDEINIEVQGDGGLINSKLRFASEQTEGLVNAGFNFNNEESPAYTFDVSLKSVNIQDYAPGGNFRTNLNINLTGDGENFDPEKINLFTVIQIDSSDLKGLQIDSTRLIFDVRSGGKERVVNLISDLADLTVTGNFTLTGLFESIEFESRMLASTFKKKIESIRPPEIFNNRMPGSGFTYKETEPGFLNLQRNVRINYLLEFKDFELLSLLLGNSEIDVDGELTGKLTVGPDSISFGMETKINQFKFWNGSDLIYLSGFDLSLNADDVISQTSLEDLSADIKLKAERIFFGGELHNLEFELIMNESLADLQLNFLYEDFLTISTRGDFNFRGDRVRVLLNDLLVKYNEFDLRNKNDIDFSYSNDEFSFSSFMLEHDDGIINLAGHYSLSRQGNLDLSVENLDGKDMIVNLFELSPEKTPDSDLNLNFKYTGTAANPFITVDFSLDSVHTETAFLGFIYGNIDYKEKLLTAEMSFFKTGKQINNPWLGLSGTIPVDLSIDSEERLPAGERLDINFFANNFDLRFAGIIIPGVSRLNGTLEGDVKITGTYDDISSEGHLKVKYSSFLLDFNNLTYLLEAGIVLKDDEITLANFSLSNGKEIKDGGTLYASGKMILDNFKPKEIDLRASGELTLLSQYSRNANSNIFGDIAIKTREDIFYILNDKQSSLHADLILKKGAKVTYSPAQTAFSNESDKFTYIFKSSSETEKNDYEIDSLISVSESVGKGTEAASSIPFDLDVKIQVEDEAKAVFILNEEFNQKLTAYLSGNIEYFTKAEKPIVGGELVLLEGSKLDFIKTFQARGSIKFLDDITNPYLDVIASYESYYNPDTLRTSGSEYEVQVRIYLVGPAKSLTGSNFLSDPRNIAVYKRRMAFGQFELDSEKTANDALYYIVYGSFPGDVVQQSNVAASTSLAILSSILGGALNEQFGDFVRSVNVQQVGTETRFSLVGKVGDVRYEIGGTSQVFQDLSRANIKIEYPFFVPSLILRLERREPTFQSTTYSEMINELGLKYSFVF